MKILLTAVLLSGAFLSSCAHAQTSRIDHVEPPFWWTGMQARQLQLMVHAGIAHLRH